MDILDIIKASGRMLNLDEIKNLTSSSVLDERTTQIVDDLMYCFNEVFGELCADYFPLIMEENIQVDGGKIAFSHFQKNVNRIYAVLDENGDNVSYSVLNDYIKINSQIKNVVVRYAFLPIIYKNYFDQIKEISYNLSERIIVLGIATEYSLYRGKLEDASIFQQKYKNSIQSAKIPSKRLYLKSRNWA